MRVCEIHEFGCCADPKKADVEILSALNDWMRKQSGFV